MVWYQEAYVLKHVHEASDLSQMTRNILRTSISPSSTRLDTTHLINLGLIMYILMPLQMSSRPELLPTILLVTSEWSILF
jgi:hypothetical protein